MMKSLSLEVEGINEKQLLAAADSCAALAAQRQLTLEADTDSDASFHGPSAEIFGSLELFQLVAQIFLAKEGLHLEDRLAFSALKEAVGHLQAFPCSASQRPTRLWESGWPTWIPASKPRGPLPRRRTTTPSRATV